MPPMGEQSREIDAFLERQGYHGADAVGAARAALEAAGLTRAGKQRIAATKLDRAIAALRAAAPVSCGNAACNAALARSTGAAKVAVAARADLCHRCAGSATRRTGGRLVTALAAAGVRRLVVVGGSPNSRDELASLLDGAVDLTLVDGTKRRTREQARNDRSRADLVLIWAPTELEHKVSNLYTAPAGPTERARLLHVGRRGVSALAQDVADELEGLPPAGARTSRRGRRR